MWHISTYYPGGATKFPRVDFAVLDQIRRKSLPQGLDGLELRESVF